MSFQKGNRLWEKSSRNLGKISNMRKACDFDLIQAYERLHNIWKVADEFGMCGQSVWERLKKRGIIIDDKWTLKQDEELIKLHQQRTPILSLEEIAIQLNRTRASIACRANQLEITSYSRPKTDIAKQKTSINLKKRIQLNGHPRGMLGKKLSIKAKEKISKASKKQWATKSQEEIDSIIDKRLNSRREKGHLFCKSENAYSRAKKGKRIDLNNIFFRSRMEANYARFLNLIGHPWEYESKTFYFPNIKRGAISYTPDFYDKTDNLWIELKGWLEPKAVTKIKRFKEHFPEEFKKLKVITQSQKTWEAIIQLSIPLVERYEYIAKRAKYLIPEWE